jgi:hypothetical protein
LSENIFLLILCLFVRLHVRFSTLLFDSWAIQTSKSGKMHRKSKFFPQNIENFVWLINVIEELFKEELFCSEEELSEKESTIKHRWFKCRCPWKNLWKYALPKTPKCWSFPFFWNLFQFQKWNLCMKINKLRERL